MRHFLLPLLLCPLLLAAPPIGEAIAGPSLWETASEKDGEYAKLLAEGDEHAISAAQAREQAIALMRGPSGVTRRSRAAEDRAKNFARLALTAYEAAAKAKPTSEEPHYRAGEVLLAFMLDKTISPRSSLDRAIEHWRQFEKKAPLDPRLLNILDARSISLTKRGGKKNLEAALADYNYQLDLIDQSSDSRRDTLARRVSNRAEIYMMLGDLKNSIAGYEKALSLQRDTTYGYGLAVALDRDKQGARARATAKDFARTDSTNALVREGTFYVPDGEVNYYLAIRAEGRGDYRGAVAAYKEFIKRVPMSPWVQQARANIKDLAPKAARQPIVKVKRSKVKGFPWQP
jgi:tetratricopeptide (TPR) repeat protein